MKLSELKQHVDRAISLHRHEDPEVVISVELPYSTIGGTPVVDVKTAQLGFDWDSGKFFIIPVEPLMPSDRDFKKKMTDLQERLGWAEYENRNLNGELKKLKKSNDGKNA